MSAPDKVSITHLFSKLPFWKSFLALCKANDAKATKLKLKLLSLSVFTDAVFTNDRE